MLLRYEDILSLNLKVVKNNQNGQFCDRRFFGQESKIFIGSLYARFPPTVWQSLAEC